MCGRQLLVVGVMQQRILGLAYDRCAAILVRHPELDVPAVWEGLRIIEAAFVEDAERRRASAG